MMVLVIRFSNTVDVKIGITMLFPVAANELYS